MSEAYRALEARFARMSHVGGALAMLQWDQQVMMPPGGNGARAEQMATLRQIAHELLTSAETGELLDRAEQDAASSGHGRRRTCARCGAASAAPPRCRPTWSRR